jgi:hypothetical protein
MGILRQRGQIEMLDVTDLEVAEGEPTPEERSLWAQVIRFWSERPAYWRGYEMWFDQRWSFPMIQMEERRRLEAMPAHAPGMQPHTPDPKNQPFTRVLTAARSILAEPHPWERPRGEQLGHLMQLLFVTRLATDPDLVWREAMLAEGMDGTGDSAFIPRSWATRELLNGRRAEWSRRLSEALLECQKSVEPDVSCSCSTHGVEGRATRQMWESTLAVLDVVRHSGGSVLDSDVELYRRPLLYVLVADDLAFIDANVIESREGAVLYQAPVKWALRRAGLSVARKDRPALLERKAESANSVRSIAAFARAGHSYEWAALRLEEELLPGARNYRAIHAEVVAGASEGICPFYPTRADVPARTTWEKYVRTHYRIAAAQVPEGPSIGEGRSVVKLSDLE